MGGSLEIGFVSNAKRAWTYGLPKNESREVRSLVEMYSGSIELNFRGDGVTAGQSFRSFLPLEGNKVAIYAPRTTLETTAIVSLAAVKGDDDEVNFASALEAEVVLDQQLGMANDPWVLVLKFRMRAQFSTVQDVAYHVTVISGLRDGQSEGGENNKIELANGQMPHEG